MVKSFLHNVCVWLCGPIPFMVHEWRAIQGADRGNVTVKLGAFRELEPLPRPTFEVLDLESGSMLENSGRLRPTFLIVANAFALLCFGFMAYYSRSNASMRWFPALSALFQLVFVNIYMARFRPVSLWSRTYQPGSIALESMFGKTMWRTADCHFTFFFRTIYFSNRPAELMTPVICRHGPTRQRLLLWPRQGDLAILLSSILRDGEKEPGAAAGSEGASGELLPRGDGPIVQN